jgi:hypothetical protein
MRIPEARKSFCVESAFEVLLEACRGNWAARIASKESSLIAGGFLRRYEMDGTKINDGVMDR